MYCLHVAYIGMTRAATCWQDGIEPSWDRHDSLAQLPSSSVGCYFDAPYPNTLVSLSIFSVLIKLCQLMYRLMTSKHVDDLWQLVERQIESL